MVKENVYHYDNINDSTLYTWVDCYFDTYIANSRFSMRVKINNHKL